MRLLGRHEQTCVVEGRSNRRRAGRVLAPIVLCALHCAVPALASERKWDGGTSGTGTNWGTAADWNPDAVPGGTDSLTLDNTFVATLPSAMNLTAQSLSIQAININTNNTITLSTTTTGTTNSILTLNGTGTATDPLLSMGANATSSTFTFRGLNNGNPLGQGTLGLQLAASGTFNVSNAGATLAIPAVISESGASRRITKTGQGTLLLTGANAYSSGVNISGGVLSINNDRALGIVPGSPTSNVIFSGGTLRISSSSDQAIDANRTLTLTGNGTINADFTSGIGTISGQITGAGRLIKTGQTTLALTNNTSNFTGGFLINQGRVNLNANNAAGTGSILLQANGSVGTGSADIGMSSATTVTLPNDIELTSTNSGSTNFDVNTSNTLTVSGAISGTSDLWRGLTAGTTGTLIFSNTSNSYVGATRIQAGALKLGASGVIPDASAVVNSATFDVNGQTETVGSIAGAGSILLGSGVLTAGADNTSTTYSGVITGTGGSIVKTGSGTLILSGLNTYTGTTSVTGGVLSVGSSSQLGTTPASAADNIFINGGTLQFTGSIASPALSANRRIVLGPVNGSGTATIDISAAKSVLIGGALNNAAGATGSLVKTGAGTLELDNAASGFSGSTTVANGDLQIGVDNGLPQATSLIVGDPTAGTNGIFNLNGHSQTIAQLTSAMSGAIVTNLGAADSTLIVSGTSSYSGLISDGPTNKTNLAKSAGGSLILWSANTYTGTTTISDGTLALGASGTIASPAIIVGTTPHSTAVFDVSSIPGGFALASGRTLSGHGTVLGGLTVSGTLSPGISSAGNLTSGNETWTAGAGSFVVDLADVDTIHSSPGVGWDHISLSSLSLATTGSGNFTVVLSGMVPANFNADMSFDVPIVDGSIDQTVLDNISRINLDASAFFAANHVTNGGHFTLDVEPNEISLHYVPEPTAIAFVGIAGTLLRRRNRDQR
jgi:autotransporter-associated beta strand protein